MRRTGLPDPALKQYSQKKESLPIQKLNHDSDPLYYGRSPLISKIFHSIRRSGANPECNRRLNSVIRGAATSGLNTGRDYEATQSNFAAFAPAGRPVVDFEINLIANRKSLMGKCELASRRYGKHHVKGLVYLRVLCDENENSLRADEAIQFFSRIAYIHFVGEYHIATRRRPEVRLKGNLESINNIPRHGRVTRQSMLAQSIYRCDAFKKQWL
ncbi:hypothetical protein EVAR_9610_1 [Eumeta japonica]|uniref:Uncharacterized protein n=1 Tax=Eumeta variegata TaxID=151549 RepID=A0A4C1TKT4_EUMVA|nr:hypothetical protein EVAR_9610_1 [Eumeta japonica]